MALSTKARKRLEVAMARRTEAKEVADTIDALSASTAGGTLTSAHILVGNSGNVAASVAVSGDVSLSNAGAVTIGAAAVTNSKLAANAVQATNIKFFKSTEQTGTGSSQNVAHGLGSTPGLVMIIPTDILAAESTYVEGAHDGTNVVVTATSGAKFKVVAVK